MTESQSLLLTLAEDVQHAADLLFDAVCNGCQSCISEISDVNRHTLSELSEGERRAMKHKITVDQLCTAHVLSRCVTQAFSAAVLLPQLRLNLQPLCEIVTSSAQLATYPHRFLTASKDTALIQTYPMHLAANKGRGAHALLIANVCSTETGRHLLPLALALEAHRNALEAACEHLTEQIAKATAE